MPLECAHVQDPEVIHHLTVRGVEPTPLGPQNDSWMQMATTESGRRKVEDLGAAHFLTILDFAFFIFWTIIVLPVYISYCVYIYNISNFNNNLGTQITKADPTCGIKPFGFHKCMGLRSRSMHRIGSEISFEDDRINIICNKECRCGLRHTALIAYTYKLLYCVTLWLMSVLNDGWIYDI